mmetsp:Transcript_1008/g.1449  ORF Transcript_1008/g.1449 Transcript_1008/m.1449 type:complete len:127 (+) Transcript_1008:105-485(+)
MNLKKHRYLVCDLDEVVKDDLTASSLLNLVKERVVAEGGEIGLGRMDPLVRFFDNLTQLAIFQVNRISTPLFRKATMFPVLRISGSMRTCRPHAIRILRKRFLTCNDGDKEQKYQERLEALQRAIH